MSEKTTGYILLGSGILCMLFATVQIIMVFTGRITPMKLFKSEENSILTTDSLNPQELFKQFQDSNTQQQGEPSVMPNIQLIDTKSLNEIFNLTIYYLIMQFLLSLGFKFASLGIQLLRPIIIEMKHRRNDLMKDESHIN
jgi:hypothetical protein